MPAVSGSAPGTEPRGPATGPRAGGLGEDVTQRIFRRIAAACALAAWTLSPGATRANDDVGASDGASAAEDTAGPDAGGDAGGSAGPRRISAGGGAVGGSASTSPAGPSGPVEDDGATSLLLGAELGLGLSVASPQSTRYPAGGLIGASLHYVPVELLAAGVRLIGGAFPASEQAPDVATGGLVGGDLSARFHPFGGASTGGGLFVSAAIGVGLTGDNVRAIFGGNVGYGIALGPLVLAPTLAYLQVYQGDGQTYDDDDARILALSVGMTLPLDGAGGASADTADGGDGDDEDSGSDSDHDGVDDDLDQCPLNAEDRDGHEDLDGCPDPDNDNDGIGDRDDRCPDEAESENGVEDDDGCPDQGLFEVENGRIVLEGPLLFGRRSRRLRRGAQNVLVEVANFLDRNPQYEAVSIEGHTEGGGARNRRLSAQRAAVIRRELTGLGVASSRLSSTGLGNRQPAADGDNDRIEIVLGGPAGGE